MGQKDRNDNKLIMVLTFYAIITCSIVAYLSSLLYPYPQHWVVLVVVGAVCGAVLFLLNGIVVVVFLGKHFEKESSNHAAVGTAMGIFQIRMTSVMLVIFLFARLMIYVFANV